MQPLSRVTTDELSNLVMENELLRYEITHVRARLAAAEKTLDKTRRELELVKAGAEPAVGADPDKVREDLVWLLTRLDSGFLGRILRRRPRIVELRQRYLSEGPT
jgi:hypothetical protein